MHAAKADQYLAQTATLLRRRQAKIDPGIEGCQV
jgi:hypothetical protein